MSKPPVLRNSGAFCRRSRSNASEFAADLLQVLVEETGEQVRAVIRAFGRSQMTLEVGIFGIHGNSDPEVCFSEDFANAHGVHVELSRGPRENELGRMTRRPILSGGRP